MDDQFTVRVSADTSEFERSLKSLQLDADKFGSTITSSLKSAITSGKSLEGVLQSIGKSLATKALDAGLKPLENFVSGAFSNLMGGILPFAKGGAFGTGGVVSTPTIFGVGNRLGVMGEAGSEAVMPLARGADGRLGVRGGGSGNVTVNLAVQTPDSSSFKRSESQIAAMLARSVSRGSRNT